jgi:hypothetical protein
MEVQKVIEGILAYDCEGVGENVDVNPLIEIGCCAMSLVDNNHGKFDIELNDAVDICIKMNDSKEISKKRSAIIEKYIPKIMNSVKTHVRKHLIKMNIELDLIGSKEEFEERCLKQFWKHPDHPERWEIIKEIKKHAVSKKEAYATLVKFQRKWYYRTDEETSIHGKLPKFKDLSDNCQYDLGRISFEMNKYGYKGLEFQGDPKKCSGYRGFGIDSGDYFKGVETALRLKRGKLKKMLNIDVEFEKFLNRDDVKEKIEKAAKISLQPHTAMYDSMKIGFEYLMVKKYFLERPPFF